MAPATAPHIARGGLGYPVKTGTACTSSACTGGQACVEAHIVARQCTRSIPMCATGAAAALCMPLSMLSRWAGLPMPSAPARAGAVPPGCHVTQCVKGTTIQELSRRLNRFGYFYRSGHAQAVGARPDPLAAAVHVIRRAGCNWQCEPTFAACFVHDLMFCAWPHEQFKCCAARSQSTGTCSASTTSLTRDTPCTTVGTSGRAA